VSRQFTRGTSVRSVSRSLKLPANMRAVIVSDVGSRVQPLRATWKKPGDTGATLAACEVRVKSMSAVLTRHVMRNRHEMALNCVPHR